MSDDERPPKSFEETARELVEELRDSIERYAQADPEDIARAAGFDPDQVRGWIDAAGDWVHRRRAPRARPLARYFRVGPPAPQLPQGPRAT